MPTEYVFDLPRVPDFWALSDEDLAIACVHIAEGQIPGVKAELRAEATLLLVLWDEAFEMPHRVGEQRARRYWLMSGLRKRTIQVLVRLSLQGLLATLEC